MIRGLVALYRMAGLFLESRHGRGFFDRAEAAINAYDAFYGRALVWLGFQAARPSLGQNGAENPAVDQEGSRA